MTDPRRHPFPRLAIGCVLFCAFVIVVLLGVDRVMGHYAASRQWAALIGPEVYRVAADRSLRNDTQARTIYLGDSVALQMFWPGHEATPAVRYLTTNQAVGVAGQFYLLRNATAHFHDLREVCLLYTPHSWANQLEPPLTKDYFCEFFHTPAEIVQIYRLKHDPDLAISQIGRLLLPNLLAANSAASLALYAGDTQTYLASQPGGEHTRITAAAPRSAEPVLSLAAELSRPLLPSPLHSPTPQPPSSITVSPLSAYFLTQMRTWCRDHHLHLRVIPCPCIDTEIFAPRPTPYDAPPMYLPSNYFKDEIHFINAKVAPLREQFVKRYGLDGG